MENSLKKDIEPKEPREYKVVVIGDCGVGKSGTVLKTFIHCV